MFPSIRRRCLALLLLLLVSQMATAAHMPNHLGKSLPADCQICLCQASGSHGLPASLVAFTATPEPQSVDAALPDVSHEGVTFRAFLQRAPPVTS